MLSGHVNNERRLRVKDLRLSDIHIIFGHHFAFSTLDEIIQAIESTSIHENKHPGVELDFIQLVFAYKL